MNDRDFIQLANFLTEQEFLDGKSAAPGFTGVMLTYPNGRKQWLDAADITKVKYQPLIFTHPSGNKFPAYRTTIFTKDAIQQKVILHSCSK